MSVRQFVSLYGLTLVVMLPLDILWLGTVGRTVYKREIGALLLDKPAFVPAAAFYCLYAIGVVVFAVSPALRDGSWMTAPLYGALFGFLAYATYDLTNLATLRGYTTTVAILDMAWGTVLTAFSAVAVVLIARALRLV